MVDYLEVPEDIVRHVRMACAHLPEAYEEHPYARVRWRIRTRTLAEIVSVQGQVDAVTYLTVHAAGEEHDALLAMGDPFFPGWGPGLVAMLLRDDTDWGEVKELVTESYCLLAPKKLIALLPLP